MKPLSRPESERLSRRAALRRLGGLSALGLPLLLPGCGGEEGESASGASSGESSGSGGSSGSTSSGSCVLIPEETDGPFPLYSTLSNSAMYRADVTEGRAGVPLALALNVVDVNDACAPISNVDVYIWHCDRDGEYSGYANQGTAGETFMRGIQTTDADGKVAFTTIYPGWYSGRITHIHLQVYLGSTRRATTQLAFPQEVTSAVYASSAYPKGQNTSVTSFARDGIFSDGESTQLLAMSGSVAAGYTGALQIGIAL